MKDSIRRYRLWWGTSFLLFLLLLLIGLPGKYEVDRNWPTEDLNSYCQARLSYGLWHSNICCQGILPERVSAESFFCGNSEIAVSDQISTLLLSKLELSTNPAQISISWKAGRKFKAFLVLKKISAASSENLKICNDSLEADCQKIINNSWSLVDKIQLKSNKKLSRSLKLSRKFHDIRLMYNPKNPEITRKVIIKDRGLVFKADNDYQVSYQILGIARKKIKLIADSGKIETYIEVDDGEPQDSPTVFPSVSPVASVIPSVAPSAGPSARPSVSPSPSVSIFPSPFPSVVPSVGPSQVVSPVPTPRVSPSPSPSVSVSPVPAVKAVEQAVYSPSEAKWYIIRNNSVLVKTFGPVNATPLRGDFDGDGITDYAAFSAASVNGSKIWTIAYANSTQSFDWGPLGAEPVIADYDGDGKTDVAVFEKATARWYIKFSTAEPAYLKNSSMRGLNGQVPYYSFGWNEVVPVPGDYDGDNKDDIAVWHPATARWYVSFSSGTVPLWFKNLASQSAGCAGASYCAVFGWSEVVPVPEDYDGDGKTDLAVWHPLTGAWYIVRSQLGYYTINYGWYAATAVPADYSGDGLADIAVYAADRLTNSADWAIVGRNYQEFGYPGAFPVSNRSLRLPLPAAISLVNNQKASFLLDDAATRVMNILSPKYSEANFQREVNRCKNKGDNTLYLYLINQGDGPATPQSFYVNDQIGGTIDTNKLNLYRQRLDYIVAKGLKVVFWLRPDDSAAMVSQSVQNYQKYHQDVVDNFETYAAGYVIGLESVEYLDEATEKTLIADLKTRTSKTIGVHYSTSNTRDARAAVSGADIYYKQYGWNPCSEVASETAAAILTVSPMKVVAAEYDRDSDSGCGAAAVNAGAIGYGNG